MDLEKNKIFIYAKNSFHNALDIVNLLWDSKLIS